jgi:hypothetical protein
MSEAIFQTIPAVSAAAKPTLAKAQDALAEARRGAGLMLSAAAQARQLEPDQVHWALERIDADLVRAEAILAALHAREQAAKAA